MKDSRAKIIRTSTIALSLDVLLKGQLRYLNQFYKVKAVSGNDRHLQNVKKREGVDVIDLPMERKISIFKDIISLVRMYLLLRKEKPDIVHSITPKAGLITMLAAKMAGVPIRIHTFTGLIFPYSKGSMKRLLILMDKLLCASATKIIPEGEGVKHDLIEYNITRKPLEVLANGNINGVDIKFFRPNTIPSETLQEIRAKYNIPENHFIYCFVGRIGLEKGINELLESFNNLYEENDKINLLLIGALDDSEEINERLRQKIKQNPSIIHVGWQDDIKAFLELSDCFVFPSHREGFPNVVLQACAMGLPCIVTNISGSNEIIQNEENGIIVPTKDKDALYIQMERLLNQPLLRNKFGKEARKTIVEKFEQQKVWDALKNEYDQLINRYLN
ncbi:glycosyltransferase [Flavobacteriaceae bacterium Ap0902]|nr:glycosyltransferase [Flavobacteriaceae bacterium Ap0902]